MLVTVEGVYKDGKVELAETPAVSEAPTRVLVTFLPPEPAARTAQPLYGAWKGKVPEDFDLDAALREIRGEWTKEWEESTND